MMTKKLHVQMERQLHWKLSLMAPLLRRFALMSVYLGQKKRQNLVTPILIGQHTSQLPIPRFGLKT